MPQKLKGCSYPFYSIMKRRRFIGALATIIPLTGCSSRANTSSPNQSDTELDSELESESTPSPLPSKEEISVNPIEKDGFEPSLGFEKYIRNGREFGVESRSSEEDSGFKLFIQSVAPASNYKLILEEFSIEQVQDRYNLILELTTTKISGELGASVISYPDSLYKITNADVSDFRSVKLNITDGWEDTHQIDHIF